MCFNFFKNDFRKRFKGQWHRLTNNWMFVLICLLLLIPLIYSLIKGLNGTYWDAAMSSWLATVFGVVVGIPIALWINRKAQASENIEKKREAKKKYVEVIVLLEQELAFDFERLKDRMANPEGLQAHPYQIEVWDAFSASGEIKWISNIELLNRIASAYSIIKNERFIEQQCYLATRGAYDFHGRDDAVKSMLKDARSFDTVLENSLKATRAMIETEIKKNTS